MKAAFALTLALYTLRLEAVVRCSGTSRQSLTVASGQRFELPINTVSGALDYEIQRAASWQIVPNDIWLLKGEVMSSRIRPATSLGPIANETLFNTDPELSYGAYYAVTADNTSNSAFQPCTQDFLVTVTPDPLLSRDSTRLVVPVAGSLRGASNSLFRTRLILRNLWDTTVNGTLVFHATGGGSDKSLRYAIPSKSSKEYADIVAAIGTEGLGSLDVLPDRTPSGYLVPRVSVQLESIASTGGSYGTDIPAVAMTDPEFGAVWTANDPPTFLIGDRSAKRYNIGVRTLSDEVTITALVKGIDGTERTSITHRYPADYHQQMTLDSFVGTSVVEGETVELVASRKSGLPGGAIVYLAATDNLTNDVSLDVPKPARTILQQPITSCVNGFGCRNLLRQ